MRRKIELVPGQERSQDRPQNGLRKERRNPGESRELLALGAGIAGAVATTLLPQKADAEMGQLQPIQNAGSTIMTFSDSFDHAYALSRRRDTDLAASGNIDSSLLQDTLTVDANGQLTIPSSGEVLSTAVNAGSFADLDTYFGEDTGNGNIKTLKATGAQDNIDSNAVCIRSAGDFFVLTDYESEGNNTWAVRKDAPNEPGHMTPLGEFSGGNPVGCVAFSPDGKKAVANTFDWTDGNGRSTLWEFDCGEGNFLSNRPPVCSNPQALFQDSSVNPRDLLTPDWVLRNDSSGHVWQCLTVIANGHPAGISEWPGWNAGTPYAACEDVTSTFVDTDSDGVRDLDDNCVEVQNPLQEDEDGDHVGTACDICTADAQNDADNDGVCGNVDNCPVVANTNQLDQDHDGQGDVCDRDLDGDNLLDADESAHCQTDACRDCVTNISNPNPQSGPFANSSVGVDTNHNFIPDVCDTASALGFQNSRSDMAGVFWNGNVTFEMREDGEYAVMHVDSQAETSFRITQAHPSNLKGIEIPPQEGPVPAPEGFQWNITEHVQVSQGAVCEGEIPPPGVICASEIGEGGSFSRDVPLNIGDAGGIEGTDAEWTISKPHLVRMENHGTADAGGEVDAGGATDAGEGAVGDGGENSAEDGGETATHQDGGDTARDSGNVQPHRGDAGFVDAGFSFDAGTLVFDGGNESTNSDDQHLAGDKVVANGVESSGCGGCDSTPLNTSVPMSVDFVSMAMMGALVVRQVRRAVQKVLR